MSWAEVAKGEWTDDYKGTPDASLLTTAEPNRAPSPGGINDIVQDHVAGASLSSLPPLLHFLYPFHRHSPLYDAVSSSCEREAVIESAS
jgi:hypothetical protein